MIIWSQERLQSSFTFLLLCKGWAGFVGGLGPNGDVGSAGCTLKIVTETGKVNVTCGYRDKGVRSQTKPGAAPLGEQGKEEGSESHNCIRS